MIVYVDSSMITRALLDDESGHGSARGLLENPEYTAITGSWSRVEVSAALARAARAGRGAADDLLDRFDRLTESVLTVVDAEQAEIELLAIGLVRTTRVRSLDAWHLACAQLASEQLDGPFAFLTADQAQSDVARALGFTVL